MVDSFVWFVPFILISFAFKLSMASFLLLVFFVFLTGLVMNSPSNFNSNGFVGNLYRDNQKIFDFIISLKKSNYNKYVKYVVFSLLFGYFVYEGFYFVGLNEEAVLVRLGVVHETKKPGWYWKFPNFIDKVIIRDVTKVNKINTGDLRNSDGHMLTKDENMLSVFLTVFWKISDLRQYVFKAKDPECILRVATESIARQTVANHNAEECLTIGRDSVGKKVKASLSDLINSYNIGIEVVDVQMGKIDPPDSVIDSYRDVQKAKVECETQKNKAESYANFVIPKARGEATFIINKAEEYKIARIASAEGQVKAFLQKLHAYSFDKIVTSDILFFEAMNKVFKNARFINVIDTKCMLLSETNACLLQEKIK
ncbi:MAG: FtsH protease activity modulator HflK [Alphaproteobacteria bacterium]|nr:MAG: FtsH protease activity modulator HflK [Alphaproteobacteria bacterium]